MSIAVLMQAHFAAPQIKFIAEAFISRGHRVMINVDSEVAYREIEGWFKDTEKCVVTRSLPVIWCGMSQVNAYIGCIRDLLAFDDWDSVINISGSCVLVKPIAQLEDYLQQQRMLGFDALVASFASKPDISQRYPFESWRAHPWEKIQNYYHRGLNLVIPEQTLSEWRDISKSPIVNSGRRFAFHASEDLSSRTLLIRPLFPFEEEARNRYLIQHRLHMGRAWYALTRPAAEWLVAEGCASLTWSVLKDSFEPDEHILHSVFLNEAPDFKIKNTNLQVDYGRTENTSFDEFLRISKTGEEHPDRFFIRKIVLSEKEIAEVKNSIWLKESAISSADLEDSQESTQS